MNSAKIGPYELNSIVAGDARILARKIPDESVDLTVTSPPYDNLRVYKGYQFDFSSIAHELYRVTKPGGVVVWVVGDATVDGSETGTSFRQALYFKEIGFNLHDTMIYRKLNGAMASYFAYLQEFEYMFVLSRGRPKAINLLRDRKNVQYAPRTTPKSRSNENGKLDDRKIYAPTEFGRRKNIWDYQVGGPQEFGYHPAIFPEALARDHILSWSNPGDLVFDPMCGSGTTCKVAFQASRNYLGFDISEEYVLMARARVCNAQPPLFALEVQPLEFGKEAGYDR